MEIDEEDIKDFLNLKTERDLWMNVTLIFKCTIDVKRMGGREEDFYEEVFKYIGPNNLPLYVNHPFHVFREMVLKRLKGEDA